MNIIVFIHITVLLVIVYIIILERVYSDIQYIGYIIA